MDEIRGTPPRILTEEELVRILECPDTNTRAGLRDRAILELLGGAGLKVQELAELRLENVDLQISCILLSGQPHRMIPFGKRTRESLLCYIYDMRSQVDGPSALLFPGRGGMDGEYIYGKSSKNTHRHQEPETGYLRKICEQRWRFLCSGGEEILPGCRLFWAFRMQP